MSPSTRTARRVRRLGLVTLVTPSHHAASAVRAGAWATVRGRLARLLHDDRGMSTVEYAIGCVAAAAFAAVLYTVVSGDSVVTALTQLVQRALTTRF